MQQRARRRTRRGQQPQGAPSRGSAGATAAAPKKSKSRNPTNQQVVEDDNGGGPTDARYAIKRLHWDTLSDFERVRGSIDLAMEAKYLSALSHPNIGTLFAVKGRSDRWADDIV